MSLLRPAIFLLSFIILSPGTTRAEKMVEPKVDYTANSVMDTEAMKMEGKVYYSNGKTRQEMGGGGGGMVNIIRRDKKVMWALMPAMNMYTEMPLSQGNDVGDMEFTRTEIGPETINGYKTTKYKILGTAKDGKKFGGFFWMTSDDINVKMDILFKDKDSKKTRMTQTLKDLKIGSVDSKLFEIPEGFKKSNFAGAMPGGPGAKAGTPSGSPAGQPDMKEMMKRIQKSGGNIDPAELKKMMGQ